MLIRLICFLFGHDWKDISMSNVDHYSYDYLECKNIYLGKRLHILRVCNRCEKIKEHECKVSYVEKKQMTWQDINKIKPFEYDLIQIKDHKDNTFIGWWSGSFWDGYRKEEFGDIVAWKKRNV